MITLEQIKEFAIKYKACSGELDSFIKYLNNGDETTAWQVVLGNFGWLNVRGLDLNVLDVLPLANYTGIRHFYTGDKCHEFKYDYLGNIINKKIFFMNGNIYEYLEFDPQSHTKHVKYIMYHPNGDKHLEIDYVDDIEVSRAFFRTIEM